MKIFLIGFMGCGKSRKGKELAKKLNWLFVDIDQEIERKTGISINEYFAKYGEDKFRELESNMLKHYPYPPNAVIAVGGGLPCFYDHIDWMNSKGITVYLEMDPAALVSRLKNREKRPLIKDMDDETLLNFIKEKLKERSPYYDKAKISVSGLNLDIANLIKAIYT